MLHKMANDIDNASISQVTSPPLRKYFAFKRTALEQFPDVTLYSGNMYELHKQFGNRWGLNYTSESGNRIVIKGPVDTEALKRTTVYLNGRNNQIVLDGLKSVSKLDIACISGSIFKIKSPYTIQGMTILCTHGSRIGIGEGCMISRDVLVYASKAHGLYSVADGSRRYKSGVDIGDRVWLGQGVRILAGAEVGEGSVIGSYSVLAGKISNNCAAAGNPCRVTTRNIFWAGEAVADDGNYFDMLRQSGKPVPAFVRRTEEEI